jgi:hypothetical protein
MVKRSTLAQIAKLQAAKQQTAEQQTASKHEIEIEIADLKLKNSALHK